MTPVERILLALDAHECCRGIGASNAEAIVVRRGAATFGTIGGQQTVAEVNDLVTLWTYRMNTLDTWYAAASPIWVKKDSAAFVEFTNDRAALTGRYTTALSAAKAASSALIPDAINPAQAQYDGLMKAMRQCYPPDGCPTSKGDWADLMSRASAVSASLGIAPPPDSPPQPVATDVDQSVLTTTAPLDIVAQVTGQEKPMLPGLASLAKLTTWTKAHEKLLLAGGVLLVGGIVIAYVAPMLGLAAKGVKGIAALAV